MTTIRPRRNMTSKQRISSAESGALGRMAFLVSVTQVESNKLPVAALEIAFVNLLGIVVELMSITRMAGQLV